jgi:vancomycin resistance protein YoaR
VSELSENDANSGAERAATEAKLRWFARLSPRRVATLVAVSSAALLSGAFVSDELTGAGVPRGTRAFGVELSHWPIERASAELEPRAHARAAAALDVDIDGKHSALVPVDAGLTIDVRASLARAIEQRRGMNVARRFAAWLKAAFLASRELEPSVAVVGERLDAKLSELESSSLPVAFAGGFRVEQGRLLPDYPRAGRKLERTESRARIVAALAAGSRGVVLPTSAAPEPVERATIDHLVADAAKVAAGEVVLSDEPGARKLRISGGELVTALRVAAPKGKGGAPELALDGEALLAALGERRMQVEQEAKPARFAIDAEDHVQIVSGQPELRLSPSALGLAALAAARASERTASLPLERRSEPALTTEQASALGIRGLVSTFTTRHPCCEHRVENIHRIADLLNGLLVKPDETVSVNAVIGPRTTKNGFVPAPTIEEGEMVETIGGGISQFATTLFNALFHGGYDIIERQPHTYWFTRYPMGHEATLSYPKPDLIFHNDTKAGMLFDTRYTKTSITVRIFGDNGGRRVEAKVSPRQNIVKPPLEIIPNPAVSPDKEHTVQGGMIGWSVIVARILHFPDGTKKEERRKVTYKPKARRVEVHPCRVPEGEKGYTGERCPEPVETPTTEEDAAAR